MKKTDELHKKAKSVVAVERERERERVYSLIKEGGAPKGKSNEEKIRRDTHKRIALSKTGFTKSTPITQGERGITLIAIIVMVIVLLILARSKRTNGNREKWNNKASNICKRGSRASRRKRGSNVIFIVRRIVKKRK